MLILETPLYYDVRKRVDVNIYNGFLAIRKNCYFCHPNEWGISSAG